MHRVLSTLQCFLKSKPVFCLIFVLCVSVVVGTSDFRSEKQRVAGARPRLGWSPNCRFVPVETRNVSPHCLSQPRHSNGYQRKLSGASYNGLEPHPETSGNTTKCFMLNRNRILAIGSSFCYCAYALRISWWSEIQLNLP